MVQKNGSYSKLNIVISVFTLIIAFLYFSFFTYSKPEINNKQNAKITTTTNIVKNLTPKVELADKLLENESLLDTLKQADESTNKQIDVETPVDIQTQLKNQDQDLPEDIKKAMATPPKIVTIDEVNTPKDEGL